MNSQQRLLLSNLRNEWWETILYRCMLFPSIAMMLLTILFYYYDICELHNAIVLFVVYSAWTWMCLRNWKFQKKRDGTLLVPFKE